MMKAEHLFPVHRNNWRRHGAKAEKDQSYDAQTGYLYSSFIIHH